MNALRKYFGLSAFNKHNTEQSSDFSAVDSFGIAVSRNVFPHLIVLKVICGLRRTDADEMRLPAAFTEGARFVLFQRSHRFSNFDRRQPVFARQGISACSAAGILNVAACTHCIACDPLHNRAKLFAEKLGGIIDNFVICRKVEQVTDFNICTVLLNFRLNIRL